MSDRFRAGKRLWEPEDDEVMRVRYPDVPTPVIARELRRTVCSVYARADKLGLTKSQAYLNSPAACRLRRGGDEHPGRATQFKKGQTPANKGLRRPGWSVGRGRMQETQFKKGERSGVASSNWRPIGTILPDPEGYLRIKVREAVYGAEPTGFGNVRVWPLLQRHTWEQIHGPVPPGYIVCFRDRDKTNCAPENLELVSRRNLMARNTVHNLPKPLKQTIQLLGALNRQIRKRSEHASDEKDRRPA
jgi:hypothetical protein